MLHRRLIAAAALLCALAGPAHAADLAASMRHDLGGNPTGWAHNWCAHYLRIVLERLGLTQAARRTNDNAGSFLALPRTSVHPGAIVVLGGFCRVRACHVGVVTATAPGKVQVISGNHGHRVGIGWYRTAQVVAAVEAE